MSARKIERAPDPVGQDAVERSVQVTGALGGALDAAGAWPANPAVAGACLDRRHAYSRPARAAAGRRQTSSSDGRAVPSVISTRFRLAADVEQQPANQERRLVLAEALGRRLDLCLERAGNGRALRRSCWPIERCPRWPAAARRAPCPCSPGSARPARQLARQLVHVDLHALRPRPRRSCSARRPPARPVPAPASSGRDCVPGWTHRRS